MSGCYQKVRQKEMKLIFVVKCKAKDLVSEIAKAGKVAGLK